MMKKKNGGIRNIFKYFYLFQFVFCFISQFIPLCLPSSCFAQDYSGDIAEIRKKLNSFESAKSVSSSGGMSDEEFLSTIASIEETEKLIKSGAFNSKIDTIKFHNEFYSSNRKPGYLLFNNDEEYSYEMYGYMSKIKYTPGRRTAIETGYSKNFVYEDGSHQVNLQKIDLSITGPIFYGVMVSGNARHITLSTANAYDEYGLDVSRRFGTIEIGMGASRNVYTGDSASYDDPPIYNRFTTRAGFELSSEMYLEIIPAFENYIKDQNSKKEVSASMLYFPMDSGGLSASVYYTYAGFKKEVDDEGYSFAYFAPTKSTVAGLGINYTMPVRKATMNFGLNFERDKYTYNDVDTQYYAASAMTGLRLKINKYSLMNMTYGFSVTRTSGFPFTQNLRLNTDIKF
ncbi:MAG TPA: hypothetical protein PKK26_09375 [Candidatus Wallbacteria bacterium]|nr:hypothetical protein [Candidatus Wallbacteria bacterium]